MDFHLATPTGDVYLFSYDGRQVHIPPAGMTPVVTVSEPSVVEPEYPTLPST